MRPEGVPFVRDEGGLDGVECGEEGEDVEEDIIREIVQVSVRNFIAYIFHAFSGLLTKRNVVSVETYDSVREKINVERERILEREVY